MNEAWQDIMYIIKPPGVNFQMLLKALNLPLWGIFGLPLIHGFEISQKVNPETSHVTRHTSHN